MGHSHRPRTTKTAGTGIPAGDDVDENDAILAFAFQQRIGLLEIVRDYDILYAGGISVCGNYGFIDRTVDPMMPWKGGFVDITPAWMVHELVEYDDENGGGLRRRDVLSRRYMETRDPAIVVGEDTELEYQPAHQLALVQERAYVERVLGIDWDAYNEWGDLQIAQAADKVGRDPAMLSFPANLYLWPYECEQDLLALRAIAAAGGPKSYMLYDVGQRGGSDGSPFWWGG